MVREWDPILYCHVWRKTSVQPPSRWKSLEDFSQKLAVYSVGCAVLFGTMQLIATYGPFFQ